MAGARQASRPRLLYAGTIPPQRHFTFREHGHDAHHETIVVLSGTVEARIAGQVLVGGPGTSIMYPQGLVHAERSLGAKLYSTLFIGWSGPDVARPPAPMSCVDRSGRLQLLMRWMLELPPQELDAGADLGSALLTALLHEWNACSSLRQDDPVAEVQRQMRTRLAEPLQLADLAAIAGLSPFHFARMFRKATGQPPMRFLRERRVEAARTLLLTTALPLRQIAARVGFADEFQLSRVFKRVTGQPPSSFRPGRGPA